MKLPIEIHFLANSGVCICSENARFLVDAIYSENAYFTQPLKEIQKAVFGMGSPYQHADYVLHTHRHIDHFHAAWVDEYALNNRVKQLFVPQSSKILDGRFEDPFPLRKAAEKGVLQEVSLSLGQWETWQLENNYRVSYGRCPHLDASSYLGIMHCAVLLEVGMNRFLFAADADCSQETAELFTQAGALKAIFVTPLFFLRPEGREMLRQMKPENVILYHIPFAEDDITGLRVLVQRQLQQYGEAWGNLYALTEKKQTLHF